MPVQHYIKYAYESEEASISAIARTDRRVLADGSEIRSRR
jgi:hypothetical protein